MQQWGSRREGSLAVPLCLHFLSKKKARSLSERRGRRRPEGPGRRAPPRTPRAYSRALRGPPEGAFFSSHVQLPGRQESDLPRCGQEGKRVAEPGG